MKVENISELVRSKIEIGKVSQTEVRQLLKEKGDAAKNRLLLSFHERDRNARRLAVAEFTLISMAKERALKVASPSLSPGWINVARSDIRSFVEEDPDERNILLGSIFFDNNWETQHKLEIVTSSRIEPRDLYPDDRQFAAGVALGKITLSNRVSQSFAQKYIPTEVS